MTRNGIAYRRLPSRLYTTATEFLSLPTPCRRDGDGFYVTTASLSRRRFFAGKQMHWPMLATLCSGWPKTWANPSLAEALMELPTGWSDLGRSGTLFSFPPQSTSGG
jgi:hypothetical protein